MKKMIGKVALSLAAMAFAGTASATFVATTGSYDGDNQTLQDYLETWSGGTIASNYVNTNQYSPDEMWTNGSTALSAVAFVFELTGNASNNSFGIYDLANPGNTLTIFAQGVASSGQRAMLVESIITPGLFGTYLVDANGFTIAGTEASLQLSSSNFGLFMGAGGSTFYSQSILNVDGGDQMVAFQGAGEQMAWPFLPTGNTKEWLSNEILLAWEDLNVGANSINCGRTNDCDYNDMVILMESIKSVPAPASAALLGLGLLGMGLARRRRSA